jgi:hypothetical protein
MKDRSSYPSEQADKFLLRLPDGMRDLIAEQAKVNGRSMNAEIVARLQETFDYGRKAVDWDATLQRLSREQEATRQAIDDLKAMARGEDPPARFSPLPFEEEPPRPPRPPKKR